MKPGGMWGGRWAAVVLASAVLATGPAGAETEREQAQERRGDVERALGAASGERAQAKTRTASLARDLDTLRAEMNRAAAAMRERRSAVAEATRAAAEAEAAAVAATTAIELRRRELAGILGAMARLTLRPPEALAALKDGPAEAAKASLAFQALLPEIDRRVAAAKAALQEAADLKAAHAKRLIAARAAADALKQERRELDRAVAEKRRLMNAATTTDAALTLKVETLASEADSIDAFFRALTAREAAVRAARAVQAEQAARAAAAARAATAAEAAARRRDAAAATAAAAAAQSQARSAPDPKPESVPKPEVAPKPEAAPSVARAETPAPKPEPKPKPKPKPKSTPMAQFSGPPIELVDLNQGRGHAAAPVAGRLTARYGQGEGVMSRGWVYDASAAAEVFAPYDGRIAYAGPFRGYGNVALIDHGGGYHTLLTGLGEVAVAVGDWVLQGEPLGALPAADAGRASEAGRPKLYVELRKDGEPVDPAPWFARPT